MLRKGKIGIQGSLKSFSMTVCELVPEWRLNPRLPDIKSKTYYSIYYNVVKHSINAENSVVSKIKFLSYS